MSVAGNEQLVRRYFEKIDADFYAEDAYLRDMSQAHSLHGREAIRAFLFMYLEEAFPDGGYELKKRHLQRIRSRCGMGVQRHEHRPLMGVPPTHRNVEFSGVSLYGIEKGLFT